MPFADGTPWPWELPDDGQLIQFPRPWTALAERQRRLARLQFPDADARDGLWLFRNGEALLLAPAGA